MDGEHLLPVLLRGDPFCAVCACEASELAHFRKRIGAKGTELIFRESVRLNGEDAKEEIVKADTTVQERNITFPIDAKLHRDIIKKHQAISKKDKPVNLECLVRPIGYLQRNFSNRVTARPVKRMRKRIRQKIQGHRVFSEGHFNY